MTNAYLKKRKKNNRTFLLSLLIIFLVTGLSFSFLYKKIKIEEAQVDKEIIAKEKNKASLKKDIQALENDYENRNTDAFKEKIARERLDMIKDNEYVYKDANNR